MSVSGILRKNSDSAILASMTVGLTTSTGIYIYILAYS